jgi:hypothetical protein
MEDRVRSVGVIVDYSIVAVFATALIVVVTFLAVDSVVIGATRAPIGTSIFDIDTAVSAV